MLNLHFITEIFIRGYSYLFIDIISILALISGVLVIINKNPIVSVLYLISLFSTISVYLITTGLNFIGLSYILVYIGAISILFLFILMLINIRVSELVSESNNSVPLIIIISIYLYYSFTNILSYASLNENSSLLIYSGNISSYEVIVKPQTDWIDNIYKVFNSLSSNNINGNTYEINYITSNLWDGFLSESSHIASIGNVLYTNYSVWLILTSIILLLAMIGSIIITIKQGGDRE